MLYDQTAIVAAYTSDPAATILSVAKQFGIKAPAVVSTILKLNDIRLRQGNLAGAKNLTSEARAKGIVARQHKAFINQMRSLHAKHGAGAIMGALQELEAARPMV